MFTSSDTAICNMALSHLGVSAEISFLATERSKEAQACRRFYGQARDELFRDFPWPFATRRIALARVATYTAGEWRYAYRMPSEAVRWDRLVSGWRIEAMNTRIPYKVESDAEGRLLYTDEAAPTLEITVITEVVEHYPPDFAQALSLLLATYIAPRVTGGDQFKLGDRALQLYQWRLSSARERAANDGQQREQDIDSEFIRVRG